MRQACCIYCRISEDKEGAGLGVTDQEQDCRELADKLGMEVIAVFTDNDRSAYSGKPRPGYEDMLRLLGTGRVSAVLAWHTDRLHRSPIELEHYITVTENIPTITVKAGTLDLATPHGRLVARQLGALARYESEHKAERVARAVQRRVFNGGAHGGRRRFGFEKDGLTIRADEAAEIVKAAEAVLAGRSLASIVRDLNARGILTALGYRWTTQRLTQMLRRPRNAAILIYHDRDAGKAPWPAILQEDQWREVVRILADPARRSGIASNRVSALGSGLYRCGLCGSRMRIAFSGQGSKVRAYRCQEGLHLSQAQAPLDKFIEQVIVERLSRSDAADLFTHPDEPDLSEVYRERQVLTGRLEELGELFAAGDIDGATLKSGTAGIRVRLAGLDARIQGRDCPVAVGRDSRARGRGGPVGDSGPGTAPCNPRRADGRDDQTRREPWQ